MRNDSMILITRLSVLSSALSVALAVSGCGPSAPKSFSPGDVDQAKTKLGAALDAWKEGKTPADLRGLKPSIFVSDHDWSAGKKLAEFRIDRVERSTGPTPNIVVVLTLDESKGKPRKKQVIYTVTTAPAITIARADDI
jgi:hypothetical protein